MDAMRERWGGVDENEFQLNSAGLAIAELADALEQANEVAEEMRDRLGPHYPMPSNTGLDTMRENKRRLLG